MMLREIGILLAYKVGIFKDEVVDWIQFKIVRAKMRIPIDLVTVKTFGGKGLMRRGRKNNRCEFTIELRN